MISKSIQWVWRLTFHRKHRRAGVAIVNTLGAVPACRECGLRLLPPKHEQGRRNDYLILSLATAKRLAVAQK
ncbi:MAG: hypothetical protein A3G59_02370 [Candidatus Taylorbacteria bacterium RIFCSPLOWO2_12_FULL_47_20]|uniref:Uncharacterized protein n=2 Tax=Candidatus Tayloriibacteriota TaxID=1817919 RepID=A0A1G2P867_9BACT|nr:MAG: hypothetical protein A3H68_01990 [Candidatus Taylorbacteria bacterium RIFCSPLOWO2_02_FULL_46_40]OHA44527.1 MAG: hypothetical protein A3G59_02370 [Candidatus Taylorbacteria bacterium RIFCSPLOWO2_12_FULL_47_20]